VYHSADCFQNSSTRLSVSIHANLKRSSYGTTSEDLNINSHNYGRTPASCSCDPKLKWPHWKPVIRNHIFYDFPQYLQANVRMLQLNRAKSRHFINRWVTEFLWTTTAHIACWHSKIKQYKPGQALRGSKRLRPPEFRDSRQMKVVMLSALRTGRLYPPPRRYSWYSFLLEAESTPGVYCHKGINF
jgi:hypothetical protein